jgi:hypothetical protein
MKQHERYIPLWAEAPLWTLCVLALIPPFYVIGDEFVKRYLPRGHSDKKTYSAQYSGVNQNKVEFVSLKESALDKITPESLFN